MEQNEIKSIGSFLNCRQYANINSNGERRVQLEDLKGKKIVVNSYSINDSKFADCKSGKCIEIHGYEYDNRQVKFFLKTGAVNLVNEMLDLLEAQTKQFGHAEEFTCKVSEKKPYVFLE